MVTCDGEFWILIVEPIFLNWWHANVCEGIAGTRPYSSYLPGNGHLCGCAREDISPLCLWYPTNEAAESARSSVCNFLNISYFAFIQPLFPLLTMLVQFWLNQYYKNCCGCRTRLATGLKLTHKQLGNHQLVSQYLTVLGNLAIAMHDTTQACDILKSSFTLAKSLHDIPTQVTVLAELRGTFLVVFLCLAHVTLPGSSFLMPNNNFHMGLSVLTNLGLPCGKYAI